MVGRMSAKIVPLCNLIIVLFAFIIASSSSETDEDPLNFLPSVVSIRTSLTRHLCIGVLLDSKTVLTAGHFVIQFAGKNVRELQDAGLLVVPSYRNESINKLLYVSSVKLHPSVRTYSGISTTEDIAIVKLLYTYMDKKGQILIRANLPEGGLLGTISWPDQMTECYFIGWTMESTIIENEMCYRANGPIAFKMQAQLKEVCLQYFPATSSNQLCALISTNPEVSFSAEDSGGPLVCRYLPNGKLYLTGLLSFGQFILPCGHVPGPAYFLRISSLIEWIAGNI